MPTPVTMYMPRNRPNSTQLKPCPQRKTIPSTKPRNGTMTAMAFSTFMPNESGTVACSWDAGLAADSETGREVNSVTDGLLAWRLLQGDDKSDSGLRYQEVGSALSTNHGTRLHHEE